MHDFHRVGQQCRNRIERFNRALGTSRQIEYESAAPNRSHAARQNRARRVLKPLAAHFFSHARHQAFRNRLRGFRSAISRPDSRATSSQNDINAPPIGE